MESTHVNLLPQPANMVDVTPSPYSDQYQQPVYISQPYHVAVPIDPHQQVVADPRDSQVYLLTAKLEKAKRQYQKYVTIAATTPTYFWVPVAGTFSAPVIAGIYGRRAVLKKKEIDSK